MNIQPDPKASQRKQQQESIKLTEDEKITLIDQLLADFQPQYPLKVMRNDEPIPGSFTGGQHGNSSSGNSHSGSTNYPSYYSIMGTRGNKRTQNSNLRQKIDELDREYNGKEEEKPAEEEGKNYRYYRDNMRCFRCRRPGHYKTVCPEQFSCIYCLSFNHNYQRCPQKIVCYRCYHHGHVVSDCPQLVEGPYCNTCKRKHTEACFFLTKGIEQVKQMFNADMIYNSEQIRCMVCLQYGHLTCSNE